MKRRRLGYAAILLILVAALLATFWDPSRPPLPEDGEGRPAPALPRSEPPAPGTIQSAPPIARGPEASPDESPYDRPANGSGPGPAEGPKPPEPTTTTVRGLILTADGKPPAAGSVHILVGTKSGFLTRTRGSVKTDGTFEIPGVSIADLDDPLKIDVGARGYLEETYKVARAAFDEGRIEIVLRKPVTISGRLVDEDGQPVAGTDIHYFHGPYVSVSCRTGLQGRFAILSPVNMGLGAYMQHCVHPRGILRWPPTDRDLDLGDVLVRTGRPIRGRVIRPDGSTVPGQLVSLYSGDRFGRNVGQMKTDAAGMFRFENRGAGPFEVYAEAGSDANGRPLAARAIDLTPGHEPVTLTLHPMVRLTVRFLDAITRQPAMVVGPTCRIRRQGDPEERSFLRQGRGHFKEFQYLLDAPATYDIIMSCAFRDSLIRKGIRLEAGEDRTIDLAMKARRRN